MKQQASVDFSEEIADALYAISGAIQKISHGDSNVGAVGIEALVMAIGGEGDPGSKTTLCGAIDDHGDSVATAIREHADAVRYLAESIRGIRG